MKHVLAILIAILMAPLAAAQENVTVIHAGWLLAVPGETPQENRSVVIIDGRIDRIEDGFVAPDGAEIIDLSDQYVLPGLIDSHVHLLSELNPNRRLQNVTFSSADWAIDGVRNARRTLLAGFTTVQDVGGDLEAIVALRDGQRDGDIMGPRMRVSGPAVTPTGGHGDINGYNEDIMHAFSSRAACNGPADCRRVVRELIRARVDLIKITATGGVLSVAKSGQNPQFMQDEVEAIVATAKDYGFTVAVHAHGKEGMERAIRAGVDSIEHGTYMDNKTMALMVDHGTWYVPTLMAGDWVTQKSAIDGFFPEMVRSKAAKIGPLIQDTFYRAHRKGVKIAFGTDTGVSRHGDNAREFALMVQGGMSPADAIRAATWNAAQLLNAQDELGSIAPGKWADMIAVVGNPLDDITTLERVRFVMKGGVVYKQPE